MKEESFTKVPSVFFEDWLPFLRPTTVCVLLVMYQNFMKKKNAPLNIPEIAVLSGVCKPTAYSAIVELQHLSMIQKTRIDKENRYIFVSIPSRKV